MLNILILHPLTLPWWLDIFQDHVIQNLVSAACGCQFFIFLIQFYQLVGKWAHTGVLKLNEDQHTGPCCHVRAKKKKWQAWCLTRRRSGPYIHANLGIKIQLKGSLLPIHTPGFSLVALKFGLVLQLEWNPSVAPSHHRGHQVEVSTSFWLFPGWCNSFWLVDGMSPRDERPFLFLMGSYWVKVEMIVVFLAKLIAFFKVMILKNQALCAVWMYLYHLVDVGKWWFQQPLLGFNC